MSTADKLNKLLETKEAIKQAIIDKGGTVGDVFADYPTAIQNIQSGGSGPFVVPAEMKFGYSSIEEFPEDWDWSEIEQVTDASHLFDNSNLSTIPPIDFSNASNLSYMFNYCRITEANINTSSATKIDNLFGNCKALQTVSEIDASNITSNISKYSSPFYECDILKNFDGFKGLKVNIYLTDCYILSYESLTNVIHKLADGVSSKTLYLAQDSVNQLSDDDIAIATNKGWTISPAKTITEPVVVTNLSQVPTETYNITPKTYDFSQYTGSWRNGSKALLQCNPYVFEADLSSSTDTSYMFYNKSVIYVDLKNTNNITNMQSMFYGCGFDESPQLDMQNVTNADSMFRNCKNMKSISELNTASVTNMSNMFYNCELLTSVSLNTSSVISINTIFYGCKNLKSITMTGGVDNLQYYGSMFNMLPNNGTFYYDPAYDYSKIIAQLPATWTAVPLTE